MSYVKDQDSSEESGHGSTVNETRACLHSDITARQGAGDHVSRHAVLHRQLFLLSEYPIKPRTVLRVSQIEREHANSNNNAKIKSVNISQPIFESCPVLRLFF